jgi:hypothetical protein
VLDALASGNVKAFGDLVSAADRLGYFNGAGTMTLLDFKSVARQFLAENICPVRQGGGIGQVENTNLTNMLLGYDGADHIKAQVGGADFGNVYTDVNTQKSRTVDGLTRYGYERLPDGILRQWGSHVVTLDSFGAGAVLFPTLSRFSTL